MSGFNFCPGCGRRLEPQSNVCPGCGMNLRRDAANAPLQPQTQPSRPSPPPPITMRPPEEGFRPPYPWMEPGEEPKPVVPLSPPPEAYRPPAPAAAQNQFPCPDCGHAVPRVAMACPNCGRRFLPASQQPQPFPQPPLFQPLSSAPPMPQWAVILLIALLVGVVIMYLC